MFYQCLDLGSDVKQSNATLTKNGPQCANLVTTMFKLDTTFMILTWVWWFEDGFRPVLQYVQIAMRIDIQEKNIWHAERPPCK